MTALACLPFIGLGKSSGISLNSLHTSLLIKAPSNSSVTMKWTGLVWPPYPILSVTLPRVLMGRPLAAVSTSPVFLIWLLSSPISLHTEMLIRFAPDPVSGRMFILPRNLPLLFQTVALIGSIEHVAESLATLLTFTETTCLLLHTEAKCPVLVHFLHSLPLAGQSSLLLCIDLPQLPHSLSLSSLDWLFDRSLFLWYSDLVFLPWPWSPILFTPLVFMVDCVDVEASFARQICSVS